LSGSLFNRAHSGVALGLPECALREAAAQKILDFTGLKELQRKNYKNFPESPLLGARPVSVHASLREPIRTLFGRIFQAAE
jgi:hypothetical protein